MNYIFKCGKNFAAITNTVEADRHKHWMIQLFISNRDDLQIVVNDKVISCRGIIVDMNTQHMFSTRQEVYFTMLIDPTTPLGRSVRKQMPSRQPYYILPDDDMKELQKKFVDIIIQNKNITFISFVNIVLSYFTVEDVLGYDERISMALSLLEQCVCDGEGHQVKYIADELALSVSRISHLFKAETGIPLKGYVVLHKLQKAYDVICNGGSITDASMKAGFSSPSHLAFTNKKMTGMAVRDIIKDSVFLKVFE